jgi:hypothetical protein
VAFLQDAGVTVMDAKLHVASVVTVHFRPALGELRTTVSDAAP